MARNDRDWMDYALLGSSLAQNAQLSSIGDQLAALKQAESRVMVIRKILFHIEDRIRFFTSQSDYSPQGRLLALMKLVGVLGSFKDATYYQNYEDKDRHSALTEKLDETVMEIARSLPPAELAEFNEAVAWQKKLPLLAQAMQLNRDMEAYHKQVEERPKLEDEYLKKQAEWQVALEVLKPQLSPWEGKLEAVRAQKGKGKMNAWQSIVCFITTVAAILGSVGLLIALAGMAVPGPMAEAVAFFFVCLVFTVGSGAAACWFDSMPEREIEEAESAIASKIKTIRAGLPPEPKQPPQPKKPSDEQCERFLLEEKIGSTFQELEAAFTEKRALVERVLEADAGLENDLSELDARALLHSTAQEVAANMGLSLPAKLSTVPSPRPAPMQTVETRPPHTAAQRALLDTAPKRTPVDTGAQRTPVVGKCAKCGTVNSGDNRFCSECGVTLYENCPGCKTENRVGIKFCGQCGVDLVRHRRRDEQRRQALDLAAQAGKLPPAQAASIFRQAVGVWDALLTEVPDDADGQATRKETRDQLCSALLRQAQELTRRADTLPPAAAVPLLRQAAATLDELISAFPECEPARTERQELQHHIPARLLQTPQALVSQATQLNPDAALPLLKQAVAELNPILTEFPDFTPARETHTQALAQLRAVFWEHARSRPTSESVTAYRELLERFPDDPEAVEALRRELCILRQRGDELIRQGHFAEAHAHLIAALVQSPADAELRALKEQAEKGQQQFQALDAEQALHQQARRCQAALRVADEMARLSPDAPGLETRRQQARQAVEAARQKTEAGQQLLSKGRFLQARRAYASAADGCADDAAAAQGLETALLRCVLAAVCALALVVALGWLAFDRTDHRAWADTQASVEAAGADDERAAQLYQAYLQRIYKSDASTKTAQEKVHKLSERQAKIAELLAEAKANTSVANAGKGMESLKALLDLAPKHAEAKQLHSDLEQRVRQARITELLAEAKANTRMASAWRGLASLKSLLELDPNHAEAKLLLPVLQEGERQRQARIAEFLANAKINASMPNAWKGLASLKSVFEFDLHHAEAKLLLPVLQEQERERQARVTELLAEAKVTTSMASAWKGLASLKSLLELDPNHDEAKLLLPVLQERERERQASIAELLAQAKSNTGITNAGKGLASLKSLLDLEARHPEAEKLLPVLQERDRERQARITELLAITRTAIGKNDMATARNAVKELLQLEPKHEEARRLKNAFKDNSLGMKFVPVPGTEVLFCVWHTRVRDYQAFAVATGRSWRWEKPKLAQGPDHPAVNVSWDDAQAFCQWLTAKERLEGELDANQSYRLPRDWEWSVAVGLNEPGAGNPREKDLKIGGMYPWGNQWPPPRGAGNFAKSLNTDDYEHTSPVGSFAANALGLYDMGGNVWQWCDDWYDGEEKLRVLRGGSWGILFSDNHLLSSCRQSYKPDLRNDIFGFRVVLVQQAQTEEARSLRFEDGIARATLLQRQTKWDDALQAIGDSLQIKPDDAAALAVRDGIFDAENSWQIRQRQEQQNLFEQSKELSRFAFAEPFRLAQWIQANHVGKLVGHLWPLKRATFDLDKKSVRLEGKVDISAGRSWFVEVEVEPEAVEKLRRYSQDKGSRIGVNAVSLSERPQVRKQLKSVLSGVLVEAIGENTPAAKSELALSDIITAVDGVPVPTGSDFGDLIRTKAAGTDVIFDVNRGGSMMRVTVRPEPRPSNLEEDWYVVVGQIKAANSKLRTVPGSTKSMKEDVIILEKATLMRQSELK